jgi:hypothetical protein
MLVFSVSTRILSKAGLSMSLTTYVLVPAAILENAHKVSLTRLLLL